jgi:hypothetical protein
MKLGYKESVIINNEKNFMTTTVGAISAFEEEFGELMNDPDFVDKFQKARKRAFDIGNDQKRRSTKMLTKSIITRQHYDYQFYIDNQMSADELSKIVGGKG